MDNANEEAHESYLKEIGEVSEDDNQDFEVGFEETDINELD